MNDILIKPQFLTGKVSVPASKSILHRAIICAAFADSMSKITNLNLCDDVLSTINILEQLGANIRIQDSTLYITPIPKNTNFNSGLIFDCGESGSTLRFMIPILLALNIKADLIGQNQLLFRPLGPYINIFGDYIRVSYNKITINQGFKWTNDGEFKVASDISSQFISGIMLTAPILNRDIKIIMEYPVESFDYILMTSQIMKKFGNHVWVQDNLVYIPKSEYRATDIKVESDYSAASFWMVAGAINGDISINNLKNPSLQGDSAILNILKKFDVNINYANETVNVKKSRLIGATVDATNIPDLVPILCVLGSVSNGQTTINNVNRLRYKESNRIAAILTNLKTLGADIEYTDNSFVISGRESLDGGILDSFNDHRIAMAMNIATLRCKDEVIIRNSECVSKSYPDFFKDYKKLGGKDSVISLG